MPRICIAPDIHADITGINRVDPIVQAKPDWLILGGDFAGWDRWDAHMVELTMKLPNTKIAVVLGNHDFYSRTGVKAKKILGSLEDFCKSMGIHFLERHNLTIGDTTFVGSCLWYDYSFVDVGLYGEEQLASGIDTERGGRWNDMRYVHLGDQTDNRAFTRFMLTSFKRRLKQAKATGNKIISVTHMLPYLELNAWPMSLYSAYSGTVEAGKALDKLGDQLVASYCGHTHKAAVFGKHTNVGNDYDGPLRFVTLEI